MFKQPASGIRLWLEDAGVPELPELRPFIGRCARCKKKHLVGDTDTSSSQSSQQCVFCGLWWHSACVDKLLEEKPGYTKCFADNHDTLLNATKQSCPNPKQYETSWSWWDMLLGHMPIASGSAPTSTSSPSPSSSSTVPALMLKRLGPLESWYGTLRDTKHSGQSRSDSE